jgi:C4-dicarboxylate-specific signal transduction histidine kinase
MIVRIIGLVLCLTALLLPVHLSAAEMRARSILVLGQSESRKRNDAEFKSWHRMTELAHANRQATAGELSSSIAHELDQPLGAILTNAETAEFILNSPSPDLSDVKAMLADIRRDDLRASEVIHRMRSLLKRTPFETKDIDLNDAMREVFEFLSAQATTGGSRHRTWPVEALDFVFRCRYV